MKRKLALILAAILMIGLLAGCASNDTSEEPPVKDDEVVEASGGESEEDLWKKEPMYGETIKVGYNGGLCTGTAGIASVLGYFEEAGLDIEIVSMQSGVDAIGTNQVQVLSSHITTLLVPTINGVNMQFVTPTQTGCKSLYVLDNDEINSTADLIGKTVAVPEGIGSSDHNIALRFFKNDDITPEEITYKPVEASASIFALENEEIQGVILSDQFAEKFVEDGTLKYIRSLTYDEDFMDEPCCVHALNKTFIEENPITARKITEVLSETSLYIDENIEEATQILFDNDWASGDFDTAVKMMNSYDWTVNDAAAEKTLINIIDDYKEFGLIDGNLDTQDALEQVWNPLLQN